MRGDWMSEAMEYRDIDRAVLAKIEAGAANHPCPGCDRIMSVREYLEQRICNDCAPQE